MWSPLRAEGCAGQGCHGAVRPDRWKMKKACWPGVWARGAMGQSCWSPRDWEGRGGKRAGLWSHGQSWERREGGQLAPKSLEMIRECQTVKLR